jgi:hypothetical protein
MIKRILLTAIGILLLIPILTLPAVDTGGEKSQKVGEQINWVVISAGGEMNCISTGFRLSGTIGQTVVDTGTFTEHNIYHAFWGPCGGPCICEPGETDGININPIDLLDIIYLINHKFKGGPPPIPYPVCSGDANCDCIVDILDCVRLIDWKFKECPPGSGPGTCLPPCSCEEWRTACGELIYKK